MKLKRYLLTAVIALSALVTLAYNHPGGMHPKSQLEYVKKQIKTKQQPHWDAYQQLIVYADSALQKPAEALADFSVPGYYVNALMHRKNSKSLMSNAFGAYACALAWQLSGEKKYADKSLEILNAWGSTNTKYSDADGSLVMSYAGSGMLMAAELLYHYEGWEKAEKKQFSTWVENVYKKACNEIRNRANNWADWGRLGSALCAQFLDDEKEMANRYRKYLQRSGFNSNTSFTDSLLLTFSYILKIRDYILLLQVCKCHMCNIIRLAEKIKRQ